MISKKLLFIFLAALLKCSSGNIEIICNLPHTLDEVSGICLSKDKKTFWVIEDSGNEDHIYGISKSGTILKDINLDKSVKNQDWEALTTDSTGNLYIGDFGNNNEKRKTYDIYKITPDNLNSKKPVPAQKITFKLPVKQKPLDFEAFVVMNNTFLIFSKEKTKTSVWNVPNTIGNHIANYVTSFTFNENDTQVTAAAINDNQNMIALLNHDKVWILRGFTDNTLSYSSMTAIPFEHTSQKEGVCFYDDNIIYITDERTKNSQGNLYKFNLQL